MISFAVYNVEKVVKVDTSDEACAVACMLISDPSGQLHDQPSWQKRVNDLICALRDERNALRAERDDLKEIAENLVGDRLSD
jgi:hypothetical protein